MIWQEGMALNWNCEDLYEILERQSLLPGRYGTDTPRFMIHQRDEVWETLTLHSWRDKVKQKKPSAVSSFGNYFPNLKHCSCGLRPRMICIFLTLHVNLCKFTSLGVSVKWRPEYSSKRVAVTTLCGKLAHRTKHWQKKPKTILVHRWNLLSVREL